MKTSPGRILVGFLALLASVGIIFVASGTISVDENTVHAPNWILTLLGLLFAGAGIATLVDSRTAVWLGLDWQPRSMTAQSDAQTQWLIRAGQYKIRFNKCP